VVELTEQEVVAIDGKTLRRSHEADGAPLHVVSAFASENGLILAQEKVDDHSNEITAIPRMLELLALKGCIITIERRPVARRRKRSMAAMVVWRSGAALSPSLNRPGCSRLKAGRG
jgi:hypothetical protein